MSPRHKNTIEILERRKTMIDALVRFIKKHPKAATDARNIAAVTLLLDRGADVNAQAAVNKTGIGGQTAIFHAVTQSDDGGLPVTQLLLERGADLTLRVKLPGDYERPEEIVDCTALGYALRFGGDSQRRTVALLRERGAVE